MSVARPPAGRPTGASSHRGTTRTRLPTANAPTRVQYALVIALRPVPGRIPGRSSPSAANPSSPSSAFRYHVAYGCSESYHWLILIAVVVVLFGAKKLPEPPRSRAFGPHPQSEVSRPCTTTIRKKLESKRRLRPEGLVRNQAPVSFALPMTQRSAITLAGGSTARGRGAARWPRIRCGPGAQHAGSRSTPEHPQRVAPPGPGVQRGRGRTTGPPLRRQARRIGEPARQHLFAQLIGVVEVGEVNHSGRPTGSGLRCRPSERAPATIASNGRSPISRRSAPSTHRGEPGDRGASSTPPDAHRRVVSARSRPRARPVVERAE